MFTSKKYVKVTECNFSNYTIPWQMQILQMSPLHFYARSYHFSDIKCLSFYIHKVGQGHRMQFS